MEVIDKMPDSQYESICDAGVDLMREMAEVLKRHGLSRDQAVNVLVVAAAGVVAASGLTSSDLAEGIDSVIHMWHVRDVDGERQASFDPACQAPDVAGAALPPVN
jgi:hypothetical protein